MDFLKLIDDALGTHFNTPVYDPAKGRDKLVKVLDQATKQHGEGITNAPNRSWKLGNNNAVRFSPKLNGQPVSIAGRTESYVPAERFQEFLSGMKAAVQEGKLDKEIKAALDGEAVNKLGVATAARTRAPSTGLGERSQPDDPEWMTKFIDKRGPAPSDNHVPNSKGTGWVTRERQAATKAAADKRYGRS